LIAFKHLSEKFIFHVRQRCWWVRIKDLELSFFVILKFYLLVCFYPMVNQLNFFISKEISVNIWSIWTSEWKSDNLTRSWLIRYWHFSYFSLLLFFLNHFHLFKSFLLLFSQFLKSFCLNFLNFKILLILLSDMMCIDLSINEINLFFFLLLKVHLWILLSNYKISVFCKYIFISSV
jgi:hypothetical protein